MEIKNIPKQEPLVSRPNATISGMKPRPENGNENLPPQARTTGNQLIPDILPFLKPEEIDLKLSESKSNLDEWIKLMDKNDKMKPNEISGSDLHRHLVLKRKLHETLGTLAKIVQNQLKSKKQVTDTNNPQAQNVPPHVNTINPANMHPVHNNNNNMPPINNTQQQMRPQQHLPVNTGYPLPGTNGGVSMQNRNPSQNIPYNNQTLPNQQVASTNYPSQGQMKPLTVAGQQQIPSHSNQVPHSSQNINSQQSAMYNSMNGQVQAPRPAPVYYNPEQMPQQQQPQQSQSQQIQQLNNPYYNQRNIPNNYAPSTNVPYPNYNYQNSMPTTNLNPQLQIARQLPHIQQQLQQNHQHHPNASNSNAAQHQLPNQSTQAQHLPNNTQTNNAAQPPQTQQPQQQPQKIQQNINNQNPQYNSQSYNQMHLSPQMMGAHPQQMQNPTNLPPQYSQHPQGMANLQNINGKPNNSQIYPNMMPIQGNYMQANTNPMNSNDYAAMNQYNNNQARANNNLQGQLPPNNMYIKNNMQQQNPNGNMPVNYSYPPNNMFPNQPNMYYNNPQNAQYYPSMNDPNQMISNQGMNYPVNMMQPNQHMNNGMMQVNPQGKVSYAINPQGMVNKDGKPESNIQPNMSMHMYPNNNQMAYNNQQMSMQTMNSNINSNNPNSINMPMQYPQQNQGNLAVNPNMQMHPNMNNMQNMSRVPAQMQQNPNQQKLMPVNMQGMPPNMASNAMNVPHPTQFIGSHTSQQNNAPMNPNQANPNNSNMQHKK